MPSEPEPFPPVQTILFKPVTQTGLLVVDAELLRGFSDGHTLVTAPGGRIAVLYRDFSPRDMAILSSTDSGLTWSTRPIRVGEFGWDINGCPHVGGGLCFRETESGFAAHAVVWTAKGNDATGSFVLNSGDAGSTWSAPAQLGGHSKSWHADIASAKDGRLAAVWDAFTETGQAVFAAESLDGGKTWSKRQRISTPSTSATHPKVVSAGGTFRVLWTAKPKSGGLTTWESILLPEPPK